MVTATEAGHWMTHRIVLSLDPETIVIPSGLMATLLTSPLCPSSLVFSWPVSMSHTLKDTGRLMFQKEELQGARTLGCWMTHQIGSPHDPDTMVFPSGLIATVLTPSMCPSIFLFAWPVSMSHTLRTTE